MGARGKGRCSAAWRSTVTHVAIAGGLAILASLVLLGPVQAATPILETPAGALDPSFASGGVLTASFGTTAGPQEGRDAAIQSDGTILVLTTALGGDYLSRYLRKRRTTGMKEGNERVLHRRSSESRWPRPCVGDP